MSNESTERLERAYRVKFDSDPTEEERSQIEQAVSRMEEGESFKWEEREGVRVLITHNGSHPSRGEELAADLRVIQAETEVQAKAGNWQVTALAVNPKQQRFCQLVATGLPAGRAYQLAGYAPKNADNADVCACLALKKPNVARYLRTLRESSALADVLSLKEKRQGLAEAWRTPVGEIDENHHLAQEVTIKSSTDKEGNTYTEKKVKMVGKLEALKLDAQLAGELSEKTTVQVGLSFDMLGMEQVTQVEGQFSKLENELEAPPEA